MEELLEILEEMKPGVDFKSEQHLIDDKVFDSLAIMALVAKLSDEFDVEILPTDVVPENFESVEAMWQLIMRLQED